MFENNNNFKNTYNHILQQLVNYGSNFRNDIDHCGFKEDARNPDNLKKEIKKAYEKIKEIL